MIIFVVAAKIWYLKNVRFLLGHPVYSYLAPFRDLRQRRQRNAYSIASVKILICNLIRGSISKQ